MPDFNRKAFKQAARELRAAGKFEEAYDPLSMDCAHGVTTTDCVTGGKSRALVLKKDCEFICDRVRVIYGLPGYENSSGSLMEIALGRALGLEIIFWYE